jgi:hypothetical protein
MKLVPSTMKMTSDKAGRYHDRADLGYVQVAPHDRVVLKDPGGTVLSREHSSLVRQIDARAVHQVDDRDPLPHRHFLSPENLANRLRPPGSCLHRRIVGDQHNFTALHDAHAGDDTSARGLAVVLIVGHQKTELEPRAARIEQALHPLSRSELSLLMHLGYPGGASPLLESGDQTLIFLGERTQTPALGRAG